MLKKLKGFTVLLTLVYATIFCVAIAAVLGSFYWKFYHSRIEQVEREIHQDLSAILGQRPALTSGVLVARFNGILFSRFWDRTMTSREILVLARSNGSVVAGNLRDIPAGVVGEAQWQGDISVTGFGPGPRVFRVASVSHLGHIVLAGRDVQELVELRNLVINIGTWTILAAIVLAMLGAAVSSRIVTRKLKGINEICDTFTSGSLSERIAVNGSGDGFDRLASGINSMLERIETLLEEITTMSDNIAHDLKSPLTRVRNELVAIRDQRLAANARDDLRSSVDEAIDETDSLLGIFETILRISEIQAGPQASRFDIVDLNEILSDVADWYQTIAEERSIAVASRVECAALEVRGDRDLLYLAVANIISNAIKYSPQGGRVEVSSGITPEGAEIAVTDNGPGIPAEFHEHVLKRFYRMEQSRSTPGNGLGLSLVLAIVKHHGGQLNFESADPGLKVRISGLSGAAGEP